MYELRRIYRSLRFKIGWQWGRLKTRVLAYEARRLGCSLGIREAMFENGPLVVVRGPCATGSERSCAITTLDAP